jgi:exopolyphosphatase / guanosine-5'-triphosphate,3'-diphosphate pyrophosphatase
LIVINKELFLLLDALVQPERAEAGLELVNKELLKLHATLERLSTDEVHHLVGLDYATVEMGRMALEEVKIFCSFTSAKTVTVPSSSMLDSLLLDVKVKLESTAATDLIARQIELAACALGRKYHFDEAHALHVWQLSRQLFDGLQEITHLPERARLLLGVAALLHDIGYYISFHSHERHSAYLITASEIMGLGPQDLERVAIVARYHRRDYGDMKSPELSHFPPAVRVELLKMSALLRLADALDDDNEQRVVQVRSELSGELLRLYAQTRSGDREAFASIMQSFKTKANLFEEIFGIEPILIEVLSQ